MTMTETTTVPRRRRKAAKGEAMRLHNFKCDDPTWQAAEDRAAAEVTSVSEVIRRALEAYGAGNQRLHF